MTLPKSKLYGVTFGAASGATLPEAAREAYLRSDAIEGCGPVYVIHNEKRYRVMIAAREVDADGKYVGNGNAIE